MATAWADHTAKANRLMEILPKGVLFAAHGVVRNEIAASVFSDDPTDVARLADHYQQVLVETDVVGPDANEMENCGGVAERYPWAVCYRIQVNGEESDNVQRGYERSAARLLMQEVITRERLIHVLIFRAGGVAYLLGHDPDLHGLPIAAGNLVRHSIERTVQCGLQYLTPGLFSIRSVPCFPIPEEIIYDTQSRSEEKAA